MDEKSREVRLPVRTQRIEDPSGEQVRQSVYCPASERSEPLTKCHFCGNGTGVEAAARGDTDFVRCRASPSSMAAAARALQRMQATRSASAEFRATVASVMSREIVCVTPAMSAGDALVHLRMGRHHALPVVDPAGHALGLVTERALLGRSAASSIGDATTSIAFVVAETSPISQAAALMTLQGVDQIPVVAEDLRIVGMIRATDLVRWIAEQDGYRGPTRSGSHPAIDGEGDDADAEDNGSVGPITE